MTKHPASCDCYECSPKHDHDYHETKVVLNCGNGSGVSIPVGGQISWQPCTVVGTVVLDTRGMKKPTVKIDFSSVVSFTANCFLFDIDLVFQLSRSCGNGEKIPLATWAYERELGFNSTNNFAEARQVMGYIEIEFKDPIAFTWCDCHECPGCCTYVVELISTNAYDITCATITSVGINALAVSS